VTLEQKVLQKLRELTPHEQEEVLSFISQLQQESPCQPRRSLAGLWVGLDVNVGEEEIAEARRDMWGGFPRELS
jgi:hypothetical protein